MELWDAAYHQPSFELQSPPELLLDQKNTTTANSFTNSVWQNILKSIFATYFHPTSPPDPPPLITGTDIAVWECGQQRQGERERGPKRRHLL